MKPKFVTTAAVVVIGAGAFLAGRSSVSTSKDSTAASEEVKSLTGPRSGSSGGVDSGGIRSTDRTTGKNGGRTSADANRPATKEARLAKLESIMRGEDPLARNRALIDYLDQLDPSELKDAVDRFRSLGITESRFGEYSMMLTAWAKADPTGALAYAKENTRGGYATNAILSAWATNDPDAAIAWAKANHTGDDANPYMAGIIRGIASTDPTRATGLMAEMPYGAERGEALVGVLPHILSQGTDATREWVASIQDERLRNGAMERVADQLAKTDPKGTADWLLANPGEASSRNMDDVISTWMEKDSKAATAYYQALPAGEARSNALRGIVNTMAEDDPQAALSFMNSHPADVTDRNIQQFVWNSMEKAPELAISQISKLGDPGAQEGMYRRTIDAWMRTDATAAKNYLQTHQLPQNLQGYVQQRLSR
ncbi:hypothetical protein KBB96_03995 [Luteolibacter ambystomatis]|uniref:HEAT repeat domain-containing protein n=1 Tax=Luteolibacter ambystomatis TaxID=2824561 RepID=A0A975J116_9BACT|nr:hypothetical protein [Luteolibacter ambystomatis]QUE52055.1 hypothetical protein KBB96_03995 [Luteolibacter ambystomatis]